MIINSRSKVAAAVLLALSSTTVLAADEEAKPAPPPGLPAGVDWTFNLDATWGAFGLMVVTGMLLFIPLAERKYCFNVPSKVKFLYS